MLISEKHSENSVSTSIIKHGIEHVDVICYVLVFPLDWTLYLRDSLLELWLNSSDYRSSILLKVQIDEIRIIVIASYTIWESGVLLLIGIPVDLLAPVPRNSSLELLLKLH